MPDTPQSFSTLLANVERLLLHGDDGILDMCYFGVHFRHDSGRLIQRILPSVELARSTSEFDGNQFVAPKLSVMSSAATGPSPITDLLSLTRRFESNESLPNLGDENYVWHGYGRNSRSVIKLRVGRILANVNAPTMADAERLARRLADLLDRK